MSVLQMDGITQAQAISYEDLYRRWEQGSWSAYELDLSQDRDGWATLTDIQRRSAFWFYSMFFYGEDSVADNLSPYIDAAPSEEQKYFLATQQVDEVRHAVFFHRFFKEVLGSGDSVAETLAATLPELGWGYRQVFGRLDRMAAELRKDRSLPRFAQAICLYHMVVEATLAQPGQHYIEDYFTKSGTMPGFAEGMRNVSRDEQRHIGFGVKVLSECFRASEECKASVAELLRDELPHALAVPVPPGFDREYTRCYGFELGDIYAFAIRSIRAKLRAAGYPLEEMPPGTFPIDPELSDDEAARRLIALLEAGVLGEPNGRPDSSPEVEALLFDLVARSIDPAATDGRPLTIQWRFRDAAPWHVRVTDGVALAEPGEAAQADVTLDTDWGTWVAIAMGHRDPAAAVVRLRLRPHGSPRDLVRLGFGRISPRLPGLLRGRFSRR